MDTPRRVLIVDDHPVVRIGLSTTLERSLDFVVCGEAGSPEAAREIVEREKPDAAILDFCLGGRDGTELVEDVIAIHPEIRVLSYTHMAERLHAKRVLRAGAWGYLVKRANPLEVVEALRTIFKGHLAISDAVRQQIVTPDPALDSAESRTLEVLSSRELQVFRLLGGGLGSAEVAADLGLNIKTVGTYRERLKTKLRIATAADLQEAAKEFVRTGDFIPPR